MSKSYTLVLPPHRNEPNRTEEGLVKSRMESGPCGICHGDMRRVAAGAGAGDDVFTAECSHQFHFRCISGTVARGRIACPLCHARWREFPSFRAKDAPPAASASASASRPFFRPVEPRVFDDDEPLAMGFVIDNLSPCDRLCVISFSSGANRLMRLSRMTDAGKAHAKRAVDSLAARGGTNIGAALRKAAKVLDDRLYRNSVDSVILLSDGQDTYTIPSRGGYGHVRDGGDANYDALVPPSFVTRTDGGRSTPVHAFGFGKDHDAAAMHTIAEATGGTFSFIENEAAIQDGFAQCIGGLLSVAVQELRLDVACLDAGVRVTGVKSGRYRCHVEEDGRAATVEVGELYADEERSFLVFVAVPRADAWDDDVTRLVEVWCSYRDMETGRTTTVAVAGDEAAVVLRPSRVEDYGGGEKSVEVEREIVRVEAIDDIAMARAAAERGEYGEAAEILRSRQRAVARSAAARGGDAMCSSLSGELREMRARVADRRRYELSGRAYVLAGLSSHAQQRATSRQVSGELSSSSSAASAAAALPMGITVSYVTPAMLDMLDRNPCAICLDEIAGGQAIFTAECSHTFHNRCIARNVAHGRRVCPLCNTTWHDLPTPAQPAAVSGDVDDPPLYADDDPVDAPVVGEQAAADGDAAAAMVIKTHCEHAAVARGPSRDNFALVVHAKAALAAAAAGEAQQRAPIDLVTVLDVSGSMEREKLALVKKAMGFVIDNLGPSDRLSVVAFSSYATRTTRLLRMSDTGKATAKRTVDTLVAGGGTNIGDGLRVAARDNYTHRRGRHADLVPASFTRSGGRVAPVHTFGFGADHDAAAMSAVAESTPGGTFSFVEDEAAIQDSFAQCVGGLLSVAAQDARIAVTCQSPGVRVGSIKSGLYASRLDADGRAASIDVGELYSGEERRFLLFVNVPTADAESTHLIKVTCTYKDTATGQTIDVAGDDAVINRPLEVTADADQTVSPEVERERVRVQAMEDIAAARAAAERGDHADAARTLRHRRQLMMECELVIGSAPDPTCAAMAEELVDLEAAVKDAPRYKRYGRASLLAGMSSHGLQRATGTQPKVGLLAAARGGDGRRRREDKLVEFAKRRSYTTEAMESMVSKSRRSRLQQMTTPVPPPQQEMSGSGGDQQRLQSKMRKRSEEEEEEEVENTDLLN
uniref:RING-type domain-containing protein n=1 Tax=Leersia perrieri TaxID=77586 RepID=A0A0D9XKE0_9ORYZ